MRVVEHLLHAIRTLKGRSAQIVDVEFSFRPVKTVVEIHLLTPPALVNASLMQIELLEYGKAIEHREVDVLRHFKVLLYVETSVGDRRVGNVLNLLLKLLKRSMRQFFRQKATNLKHSPLWASGAVISLSVNRTVFSIIFISHCCTSIILLMLRFLSGNFETAMDTLTSMKVLRQVVESGSFVAAAERLNLSTAMISKHVMHLERHLGVRLLNRSSRHLSLTEAGTVYYEHCQEMLDNLAMVEATVRQSAVVVRGILKVNAPVWFANPLFTKALAEYRSRYPDVSLDLSLNDRVVDLVEEGFDLALRVMLSEPAPSPLTQQICSIPFLLVGSSDYLQRNGYPKTPNELSKHMGISYHYSQVPDGMILEGPNGREAIKLPVSLRSNNTMMMYQAVVANMGVAILPEWLIADDLASQRLEVLELGHTLTTTFLYAVYPSQRYLSPKIRTFVDFLAEYFSGNTRVEEDIINV
jgi:DNA-binding transcriptional LysR family regulator